MEESSAPSPRTAPRWKPIKAIDRRVLGVLAEKAKTTPDQYPLSLNSLVSGCNQKSNRYPLMELEQDAIQDAIDRLKQCGAMVEIQGSSRVARFRHLLYDWLGVEKIELSVMTELLLRGAQTEGELRQRAGRMDTIADLNSLRGLLQSLQGKGLVQSLTPEGRGHVVAHTLYEERELEKVRAEFSAQAMNASSAAQHEETITHTSPPVSRAAVPTSAPANTAGHTAQELTQLKEEVASLREQVSKLRYDFEQLRSALQ